MADRLRVVLAEDHYLVREGTRALLEQSGEVEVVAAVGSADSLLDAVNRLSPDAVLTDIRMPPGDGLEGVAAAKQIRGRHPAIGVVVFSQHADVGYLQALLSEGAAGLGYLLKERLADRGQLVQALRETSAGGSVVDPVLLDALVKQQRLPPQSPLRDLTPRELDVLREMAKGGSNPAVASTLSLSVSAVEKHVNAIFAKLGLAEERSVHRRVVAVVTYLRESNF